MRSRLFFIIAILIAIGFVFFAFTRTVNFHESAVRARLGDASDTREAPGVIFRLPAPLDTVTVYDNRNRLLQLRSETQQTADNRQIVVEAFLTWRITDPMRFYQRFGGEGSEEQTHYLAAERSLQSQLRSAMSEVSRYRLNDLFTPQLGASKLSELEERVAARLNQSGDDETALSEWGIESTLVGISRIVLPEETTKDVFARMKATQERLADEALGRGEAAANAIIDSAEADAQRIRSFADRRAAEIRVRGDREAAPYIAQLSEDEDLAVFLEQISLLRDLFGKRSTLLLGTDWPGLSVFDPSVLSKVDARTSLPPFTIERDEQAPEQTRTALQGEDQ